MKTVLVCDARDEFAHDVFVPWLRGFSDLEAVVEIHDTWLQRWTRARAVAPRWKWIGAADALAFRLYYACFLARRDRRWKDCALALTPRRYAVGHRPVTVLRATDINDETVQDFLRDHPCDVMLSRSANLLGREVCASVRVGAFVVDAAVDGECCDPHAGLAARSRCEGEKTRGALLRIGSDSAAVFAYLHARAAERRDSHVIIQERMVLHNLDGIADHLRAIAAGESSPIDMRARPCGIWAQPTLSAYVRWKVSAHRRMRRSAEGGALLYHDVFTTDPDATGFPGRGAGVYKLRAPDFEAHLDALARVFPWGPTLVRSDSPPLAQAAFMLTFDDGGQSSLEIADRLELRGWRGHFFVTAGRIAQRGFLTAPQIRELHRRGHAIGTHSMTHAPIISALPPDEIYREWQESAALLADILGERVRLASVPGGYCSRQVVAAAERAGIRFLWTSEPVRRLRMQGRVQLLGRYSLKEDSAPARAVALADYASGAHAAQWIRWNALKTIKKASGRLYPFVRQQVLARSEVRHDKV